MAKGRGTGAGRSGNGRRRPSKGQACPSSQLCLSLLGTDDDGGQAVRTRSAVPGAAGGKASPQAAAVNCRFCGRRLDVPAWLREADVRLHYCDETCRRAWVEAEPDLAVRLDGLDRRRRRGANWAMQARRARERDRFTCQSCGITEEELGTRLHVHHRIPFRRFRSNVEANKLEHLVSVCAACHQKEEAQLRRQLPLFAAASGASQPAP